MRPKSRTLTELELEIMKIVWQLKSATVRDVYESLLERRRIAYTTVMTMMKILEQKQYLKRRLEERAYVYQATRSSHQVIKGMVREFVNRVFDGSARPLLAHLVEDRTLSADDLKAIARLLKEAE
jgi:BlaI family penicillinase repressor